MVVPRAELAVDAQPPAVALDDMLDDREAKPGAAERAAAAGIDAVETLGDPRDVLGRDALALVGDRQVQHRPFGMRRHGHRRARLAVAQRIGNADCRAAEGSGSRSAAISGRSAATSRTSADPRSSAIRRALSSACSISGSRATASVGVLNFSASIRDSEMRSSTTRCMRRASSCTTARNRSRVSRDRSRRIARAGFRCSRSAWRAACAARGLRWRRNRRASARPRALRCDRRSGSARSRRRAARCASASGGETRRDRSARHLHGRDRRGPAPRAPPGARSPDRSDRRRLSTRAAPSRRYSTRARAVGGDHGGLAQAFEQRVRVGEEFSHARTN